MKKILAATTLAMLVCGGAFARDYNPFRDVYKQDAHRELLKGVAQYNFIMLDENGAALANATLNYVNHDNKLMQAKADANGKVHLEFREPNFVQLVSLVDRGSEYRIIGDDISDDADFKDIQKGDVSYSVIQRHKMNKAAYVYDAD